MVSMAYDLANISVTALMRPAFDAGIALTRLDERIARSPVGPGWLERSHFADACASLWIDGELVHLEDLVLHDDVVWHLNARMRLFRICLADNLRFLTQRISN
jgi:hypothetical protein